LHLRVDPARLPDPSLAHPPTAGTRNGLMRTPALRLASLRPKQSPAAERPVVPPDPRLVVSGPLDPNLDAIRAALQPHRRRLWLRRMARRAWIALAVGASAEAILFGLARLVPIEVLPSIAVAIAIVALGG